MLDASGDHGVALVVFDRALEDHVVACSELRLDVVGVLARLLRHLGAIGRDLDQAFLEAAAVEVRDGLALGEHGGEARIEHLPVPFGAGEMGLRRERRSIDVVARDHGAAARGVLHHGLRSVDVARDDVDADIDQAVGGLRFFHRHRPVAGEDDLQGRVGIGGLRAQHEGVDVAEHLRDRLRGHEAELARLGGMACDDAGDVLRLVDITEIAADVLRVLLGPQAARVLEPRLRIFVGELEHMRAEVAVGGREQECRAVEIDHGLHGLLDRIRLRHFLFLDHLDAGHLLERRGAGGVGLVVAVVVARPDIDEADGGVGGVRQAARHGRRECGRGTGLQQAAPGNDGQCHGASSCPWNRQRRVPHARAGRRR